MHFYIFFLLALTISAPANAYIGPGLGVAVVWTFLGPVAGVLSALVMLSYFPIRYWYKKRKHKKLEKAKESQKTP